MDFELNARHFELCSRRKWEESEFEGDQLLTDLSEGLRTAERALEEEGLD